MDTTRQLRVMVLDASPTSCKILEVILRREGHRVVSFGDPLEALRFFSRHGPADLLFLGIDLPKMDGYDVLKYLKGEPRLHSMVPIALLSEGDGMLGRIKARLAGARQVVVKPLVRQQIAALTSAHTCQRDATREGDGPTGTGDQGKVGRCPPLRSESDESASAPDPRARGGGD